MIVVKAGGDFQAALDRAKSGDTIQLQAGATFKGAFKLPKKTGEEFYYDSHIGKRFATAASRYAN